MREIFEIWHVRWHLPFLVMGLALAIAQEVSAQQSRVGLGGQIGDPTGVTLKFRDPGDMSVDILAAWDVDDFVFVNVHGLFERHIGRHEDLHLFYGPGAYVGVRDRPRRRDDDVVAGVSAAVGLGILFEPFEIFGQIVPRLDLAPATDGDLGAGVGVRFYF